MKFKAKTDVVVSVPALRFDLPSFYSEEIRQNFQIYAAELGSVAFAWNNLHETLAELFWCITGSTEGSIPLACWHAIESDRAQRKMLRVATEARAESKILGFHNEKASTEVIWLLRQVDRLADKRNDALHSPYRFIIQPGPMKLEPDHFKGHARATNLKGKDLLSEFKWYRATADTLTIFARHLILSIWNPHSPWPDRPSLPTRGQKPPNEATDLPAQPK